MNIHYFQHVPYEDLGSIQEWVYKPGNFVTATRFYENDKLPFIDAFDMLIVLGGPMSTSDEQEYSWLIKEKELIRKAIQQKKMVLGICLGAQLLAEVLGSKVYPNKNKEIGWFPVEILKSSNAIFNSLPPIYTVFHWHGDTFDLPEGTELLASTKVTTNQAFWLEPNLMGLQFHIETNQNSIDNFLLNGQNELSQEGQYISSSEEIKSGFEHYGAANQKHLFELLNYWASINGFSKV
ncbi:MAG: type 1 glutamine amidotransferase [Cytophagales bacterium]|nr:MAG: type 1 glutamine amidotransferase [Cytophagales bacterium]